MRRVSGGECSKAWFSRLCRYREGRVQDEFSIELPCHPFLWHERKATAWGEAKPNNQNHAVIFTRGEALQAIDMNQASTFEGEHQAWPSPPDHRPSLPPDRQPSPPDLHPDNRHVAVASSMCIRSCADALKYPYLLQEFDRNKNAKVLGICENIFTGGLSSSASFMTLQDALYSYGPICLWPKLWPYIGVVPYSYSPVYVEFLCLRSLPSKMPYIVMALYVYGPSYGPI